MGIHKRWIMCAISLLVIGVGLFLVLEAKIPENYNIFLCTVEYKGLIEHDDFGKKIECYEIQEWVPVYPIVRNRILPQFFYPRSYMTKHDLIMY